jgi:uncharacterized protein (DUF983 family)
MKANDTGMSDSFHDASSFRDLLRERDASGPYQYSSIFSDQSLWERARSRAKFKLLRRIDYALRPMLRRGEKVVFITRGNTAASFLEGWFLGLVLYYLNRRAIVLTTERVLLLQINSRGRPRALRSQIRYDVVKELSITALGNLQLKFRGHLTEVVTGVPRRDRKILQANINEVAAALDGANTQGYRGIENLCPHCYEPVLSFPRDCPECGGSFKSSNRAALMSLVFPGVGDLYLGHGWLAALEVSFAAIIWLAVLVWVGEPTMDTAAFVTTVTLVVLIFHGVDALTTLHLGRKGLHPRRKQAVGHAGWFAAAAVVPALVLFGSTLSLVEKSGLKPLPQVVAGDAVPAEHVRALQKAGYVNPNEDVLLFYSNGTVSVLEDGNLLTTDRVVSYAYDFDSTFYASARYGEVVDVFLDTLTAPSSLRPLYIVPRNGEIFYLLLPTFKGQDRGFLRKLEQRWRAVRAASNAKGVWYDGGSGFDLADPVLIRGAAGQDARQAEVSWINTWFGVEGGDWTLDGVAHRKVGRRRIDELHITLAGGERQILCFDVTGIK